MALAHCKRGERAGRRCHRQPQRAFHSPPQPPTPTLHCTHTHTHGSETYRCRFTAKYKALGADSVRFVNSELTHVALIKAGCNVFMNYRGNWNFAQEDNNSKECECVQIRITLRRWC